MEIKKANLTVVPSPNAVRQSALYANAVRSTVDPNTALLYFFSVGGDAIEVAEKRTSDSKEPAFVVALDPVAKIAFPAADLPKLIDLLERQYQTWKEGLSSDPLEVDR